MSAFEDLARMAEWLDHAQEDASGVPTCNPEECHKCIALRALEEAAKARAEGAAQEREACLRDYVDLVTETPPSKHVTPLALSMRMRARGESPRLMEGARKIAAVSSVLVGAKPSAPKCQTCGGDGEVEDVLAFDGYRPCPDCAPKPPDAYEPDRFVVKYDDEGLPVDCVSVSKPAARELLQRLWTKAVGTEGYDKAEWKALERALEGTSAKQKP